MGTHALRALDASCPLSCRQVELTDEGQQHVPEVGSLVFKYIRLIGASTEAQWAAVHEEVRNLSQIRFNFRDKPTPYNYVTSLSGLMQQYDDSDLLLAMYHVPQVSHCQCPWPA